MEEVKIKNELNLKVYINGTPDLKEMPVDLLTEYIYVLKMQIENKIKRSASKST